MKKASTRQPGGARDALQIVDRMLGDDRELRALVVEAGVSAHIAQLVYDARTAAGLTQTRLARFIGSRQPVNARLENTGYEGHSLAMLQREPAARTSPHSVAQGLAGTASRLTGGGTRVWAPSASPPPVTPVAR